MDRPFFFVSIFKNLHYKMNPVNAQLGESVLVRNLWCIQTVTRFLSRETTFVVYKETSICLLFVMCVYLLFKMTEKNMLGYNLLIFQSNLYFNVHISPKLSPRASINFHVDPTKMNRFICQTFAFAYLWGVGGNILEEYWDNFDTFVRQQFDENPDAKVRCTD